jgi:undecaprenyl-phosphate 4-deoxy-4-formamido-L-arabinose transferase
MLTDLEPRTKISVVVPLLNEEGNVPALLERLDAALSVLGDPYEVICVDDGSSDNTLGLLREKALDRPWLEVIGLARNVGQHAAILAGFGASAGEWILTIDADLQNPPEEIHRIVAEFRKGHDLVGTYREDRQDSLFRRGASRMVNVLMRKLSKIQVRDFGCMLRGYSREVAREISNVGGSRIFIPAVGTLFAANPTEIPVSHVRRVKGKSKYSSTRLVGLAFDLCTCVLLVLRRKTSAAASPRIEDGGRRWHQT